MSDPIPVHDLEHAQRLECSAGTIGGAVFATARGNVFAADAPGIMSLLVQRDDGTSTVGILTFTPDPDPKGLGMGLIVQFSPDMALQFAASLLRVAKLAGVSPPQ